MTRAATLPVPCRYNTGNTMPVTRRRRRFHNLRRINCLRSRGRDKGLKKLQTEVSPHVVFFSDFPWDWGATPLSMADDSSIKVPALLLSSTAQNQQSSFNFCVVICFYCTLTLKHPTTILIFGGFSMILFFTFATPRPSIIHSCQTHHLRRPVIRWVYVKFKRE